MPQDVLPSPVAQYVDTESVSSKIDSVLQSIQFSFDEIMDDK